MARPLVHCVVATIAMVATPLAAQKVDDACALLKPADFKALSGTATVGNGTPSTNPPAFSICEYRWGTGSVGSGASFLRITAGAIAKTFPGMAPAMVKESFLMAAKEPNHELIPGVGDVAVYESGQAIEVKTSAVAKGAMVELKFDSGGARSHKDQMIALLKTVISRL
jgi:hypothetical protein